MKKAVYRAIYSTPEEVVKKSIAESLEIVEEEPKKEEKKKGRKKKDA
jgi:hypothetical protein